jgi:phosphate:Na+ symporter
LEALKEKAIKSDLLLDGTLDKLIREQKISSTMATSLLNDSDIVANLIKKLIDTTELLYTHSDTLIASPVDEEAIHLE